MGTKDKVVGEFNFQKARAKRERKYYRVLEEQDGLLSKSTITSYISP